jgi:hypothetical protein
MVSSTGASSTLTAGFSITLGLSNSFFRASDFTSLIPVIILSLCLKQVSGDYFQLAVSGETSFVALYFRVHLLLRILTFSGETTVFFGLRSYQLVWTSYNCSRFITFALFCVFFDLRLSDFFSSRSKRKLLFFFSSPPTSLEAYSLCHQQTDRTRHCIHHQKFCV